MQPLERPAEPEEEPSLQFLIIQLGPQLFALEVHRVVEILRNMDLTLLPGFQEYMEGVIEVRGKVIPVVDLRKRLGFFKADAKSSRILIVHAAKKTIAILVDAVHRVVRMTINEIQPPPEVEPPNPFVLAVLKSGNNLHPVLNLDAILSMQRALSIEEILPER